MPSRIIYGVRYKDLAVKQLKAGKGIYKGIKWFRVKKLTRTPPGHYPFSDKDYWRVTWSFRKKPKKSR